MAPKKAVKMKAGDVKSQSSANGKAKQSARPNSKKQNPLSIGEIRNMVYTNLLQAMPNDGRLTATHLTLDSSTDAISEKAADTSAYNILDVVPKSGHAKAFGMSLAQVPEAFNEFLSLNADRMTFAFLSAASLINFGEMFRAYIAAMASLQVPIRVAIFLFHPQRQFGSLEAWDEVDMAHGYDEGAHGHVKEWVDAVQTLPTNVKVSIILARPWRDYRSLRGVTAPLRARAPDVARTVEVAVEMDRWDGVPDKEFHLGMTVASIEGVEMVKQSQISEREAEELVKFGCRGFRSIK